MAFGDTEDLTAVARTLDAAATSASITVHHDRSYTLINTGRTNAGVSVVSPAAIAFKFDVATATFSWAAGTNTLLLLSGQSVTLPPGITTISYITNAVASIMFNIVGSPVWFGDGH